MRNVQRLLFCISILCAFFFSKTVNAAACSPASATSDGFISIASCGASPENQDNFKSLEQALAIADSSAGIRGVFIPAGRYKMTVPHTIIIHSGKEIKGAQDFPHVGDERHPLQGPALLVSPAGELTTKDPLFLLRNDAILDGVTIHYIPQNDVGHIIAYPPTITMEQGTQVSNVTLTNSYFGISATGGIYGSSGDHVIRNVNMTAFYRGIVVDKCGSTGRIENVNIHPQYWWWSYRILTSGGLMEEKDRNTLDRYLINNLHGYVFHWTDWETVSGSFVFGAHTGFEFETSPDASPGYQYNADSLHKTWAVPSVLLTNSGADLSYIAMSISASSAEYGIRFDNGILAGLVNIGKDNYGPVLFSGTTFRTWASWGNNPGRLKSLNPAMDSIQQSTPIIIKDGPGILQIMNSTFFNWDYDADTAEVPAIDIEDGSAIITGSSFTQNMIPKFIPTKHEVTHIRTRNKATASLSACISADTPFKVIGKNIMQTGNQATTPAGNHYPPMPSDKR